MRRFCAAAATGAAILLALGAGGFAFVLHRSPVFARGERYEFYLGANSSSPVLAAAAFEKLRLGEVAGESARYAGDCAEEILERFRAEILFCEETEDAVNYYCYSPLLGACVTVRGYAVNLHVAKGRGQTAAGTPLIFGGF